MEALAIKQVGSAHSVRSSDSQPATAPRSVFHYTDFHGLVGIVQTGGFWLSNACFLNDRSEIFEGIKLANEVLDDFTNRNPGYFRPDDIRELKDGLQLEERYYIASFSMESDCLNQWRCYSHDGKGVCIEFDLDTPGYFSKLVTAQMTNVRMEKVVYQKNDKEKAVEDVLRLRGAQEISALAAVGVAGIAMAAYNPILATLLSAGVVGSLMVSGGIPAVRSAVNALKDARISPKPPLKRLLNAVLPFFKNEAFADEREYRIAWDSSASPSIVRYRATNDRVVPYVHSKSLLPEGESETRLPMKSVLVGPCLEQRMACRSVQLFLKSQQYDVPVEPSNVPYR